VSHLGVGRVFHRLVDIAACRLGQRVFEPHRRKPFRGRAEGLDSLRERVRRSGVRFVVHLDRRPGRKG